jgi:hypothetical protein
MEALPGSSSSTAQQSGLSSAPTSGHGGGFTQLRELYLVIYGPAFGLDFSPVPPTPGEAWPEEVSPRTMATEPAQRPHLRWSNTYVSYVSTVSPLRAFVAPGDPLVAIDGQSVSRLPYEQTVQHVRQV